MVTSRLKMRSARNLQLSFSGQLLETVAFFRDETKLLSNLKAGQRLVEHLGKGHNDPSRSRSGGLQKWEGWLWDDVAPTVVAEFLLSYQTHPESHRVNSALLADFLQQMNIAGELSSWTIALIGGGTGEWEELAPGVGVKMLRRTKRGQDESRYSIGRLLSPRDEAIDMDEAGWIAALDLTRRSWIADPGRRRSTEEPDTPNGPAIRQVRGFGAEGVPACPERGLLLLYLLDPTESKLPAGTPPVLAFGMSFPGSNSGVKVEYMVNNVEWELRYGAAD
jgi:hypothetical protein